MAKASKPEPDPGAGAGHEPDRPLWRTHLWEIQPVRDVLMVLLFVGLFWLGMKLSLVTVPLMLAMLLAYLCEPVVRLVTKGERISRSTAAAGIIVGAALVVVVPAAVGLTLGISQAITSVTNIRGDIELVYVALANPEDEAAQARIPKQWEWVADQIRREFTEPEALDGEVAPPPDASPDATPNTDGDDANVPAAEQEAGSDAERASPIGRSSVGRPVGAQVIEWLRANADAISASLFRTGRDALSATAGLLQGIGLLFFGGFLTAFFFYFISTGWAGVLRFGDTLIPDEHRERAHSLIGQFDQVIAGFIRGRITIAVIQSIIFTILYTVIGTPAALLFGVVIGFLSIVPYLALIGIPATIIAMWLDPAEGFRGAWWWIVIAPVVVYNIGQAADDYFLTPRIQGKSTNLDTPTILFASLAGGILFGVFGLLIAIPLVACAKIALRELFWPRFKAWAEGREADFLPINRN